MKAQRHWKGLAGFLFGDNGAALDRYEALLAEEEALREQYRVPDPARRRLRVMCNTCEKPWCCYQRTSVDFVESLVVYRYAAQHAPVQLEAALERARAVRRGKAIDDAEYFRKKEPCAFLVKGRCSVYAVRPHVCRTHYMAGASMKCRDELVPAETYAMDPDPTIVSDLARIADDVGFFAQIEGVEPRELCEVLLLIDTLGAVPAWKKPRRLTSGDVEPPK